jgi:hypothetical protein
MLLFDRSSYLDMLVVKQKKGVMNAPACSNSIVCVNFISDRVLAHFISLAHKGVNRKKT